MPPLAIALLAAGTFALRLVGPVFGHRMRLGDSVRRLLNAGATVLLVALAAVAALTSGHHFAGWARLFGVLVALGLALRRTPLPIVVVAAAATTAAVRLLGLA